MVRIAFLLAALLVARPCASLPETIRGEVALTDSPFCEFFVVKTNQGFSLLDWSGGLYVIAEGDVLDGPLSTTGLHVFAFSGSGEMKAQVEEVGVTLTRAQQAYFSRCHKDTPGPPLPSGAVAHR